MTKTIFITKLIALALLFCSHSLSAWGQNATNPSVNAQLLVAARESNLEGVIQSLERGAAPNSRNRLGKTSLYIAIEKNNLPIFKQMLAVGADVNLPSLEKVTPLIAAAYAGNPTIVALLIEKGAKLEEEDRLHKSALVYAAGMGHTKVV